jgi:ABC-type dipeptide/oligopeptide/nickel transport system permease subunit
MEILIAILVAVVSFAFGGALGYLAAIFIQPDGDKHE